MTPGELRVLLLAVIAMIVITLYIFGDGEPMPVHRDLATLEAISPPHDPGLKRPAPDSPMHRISITNTIYWAQYRVHRKPQLEYTHMRSF